LFARQAEFGQRAADRRWTHRDLRGRGQRRAQRLERGSRGRVHECLEGLETLGRELGRVATAMWLGGHIAGGALTGEEIADTAQTEPEARGSLPHRALVALIGWHHSET
jgi:hypothetical protein